MCWREDSERYNPSSYTPEPSYPSYSTRQATPKRDFQQELSDLQKKYDALEAKYDALQSFSNNLMQENTRLRAKQQPGPSNSSTKPGMF